MPSYFVDYPISLTQCFINLIMLILFHSCSCILRDAFLNKSSNCKKQTCMDWQFGSFTIIILSVWTDWSGQTRDPDQTPRSSLIRVFTVCHCACIFMTHYSVVKRYCSNFSKITSIFLFVWMFFYFYGTSNFNNILVISGWREGDNEGLCAMNHY